MIPGIFFSYDSWTHLGIGKFIISTLRIPEHTDISFKSVENALEFLAHSWLSDVMFYFGYQTPYHVGIFLIMLVTGGFSLFLLHEICVSLHVKKSIIYLLLFLATLMGFTFWKIHPLVFITPLSLLFLYGWVLHHKGSKKILLISPLVFLLWAQQAGGYIFILGIFAVLFLIAFIFHAYTQHRFSSSVIAVISVILGFAASLLNPWGVRIWIYFLTIVSLLPQKWTGTLIGALTVLNQNYVKQPPSSFFYTFFLLYAVVFFLVFTWVLINKFKTVASYIFLLPVLFGFFLAYKWVRLIPLTAFITLPFFGIIFQEFVKALSRPMQTVLMSTIFIVVFIIAGYIIIARPALTSLQYPTTQVRTLKQLDLPSNILTTQDYTGYVFFNLFPRKALLDAQDDLLDDHETLTYYSSPPTIPEETFANIVKDNDLKTAITSRDLNYLANTINTKPDWTLVYFDELGYLFTLKKELSTHDYEENALKHIWLTSNLGFDLQHAQEAIKELQKFIQKYPGNTLAIGQLATIYRVEKQFQKAENILLTIPPEKRDLVFMTEMGRIKAAQGMCQSSREWYEKALGERREQQYSRAVLDLAVLYAGCFNDRDKAKHYFARYNSFVLPVFERERVRQIAEKFGIQLIDD